MNTSGLVGAKVDVLVSDPWEFGTECGVGPFPALVESANGELLLRLEAPIQYRGAQLLSVVAAPRHSPDSIDSLASAGRLCANMSFLRTLVTNSSELTDQAKAGMVPAIGSIEIRSPAAVVD
jgi:hypothetical protein